MLKWFSFLLRVHCTIFARAINADVWRAMVARAIESQKTLVNHLKNILKVVMLSFKDLKDQLMILFYFIFKGVFYIGLTSQLPFPEVLFLDLYT